MRSSASSVELAVAVRSALAKGGAERIDDEVRFVLESIPDMVSVSFRDEVLKRLESGESPYLVIGRYPMPDTRHWIAVPEGVMPPGCDTADAIAVIRHVVRKRNPDAIADVGCGTGVLGLAALLEAPSARGLFLDIDATACEAARGNVERLGLLDRSLVVCQDAAQSLAGLALDLIVANLPFVPTHEVGALGARFRDFAPRSAVDGGSDGMAVFQRLGDALHSAMRPSGSMILQFGSGQRKPVLESLGARWTDCPEDSLGYPNLVVVRWTN